MWHILELLNLREWHCLYSNSISGTLGSYMMEFPSMLHYLGASTHDSVSLTELSLIYAWCSHSWITLHHTMIKNYKGLWVSGLLWTKSFSKGKGQPASVFLGPSVPVVYWTPAKTLKCKHRLWQELPLRNSHFFTMRCKPLARKPKD